MTTYKLLLGGGIRRGTDGATIPPDQLNADYQTYLVWMADGNTPIAADPEPIRPPRIDLGGDVPPDQDAQLSAQAATLRDYVALASPTATQTVAALKLLIRIVLWSLKRQGL